MLYIARFGGADPLVRAGRPRPASLQRNQLRPPDKLCKIRRLAKTKWHCALLRAASSLSLTPRPESHQRLPPTPALPILLSALRPRLASGTVPWPRPPPRSARATNPAPGRPAACPETLPATGPALPPTAASS